MSTAPRSCCVICCPNAPFPGRAASTDPFSPASWSPASRPAWSGSPEARARPCSPCWRWPSSRWRGSSALSPSHSRSATGRPTPSSRPTRSRSPWCSSFPPALRSRSGPRPFSAPSPSCSSSSPAAARSAWPWSSGSARSRSSETRRPGGWRSPPPRRPPSWWPARRPMPARSRRSRSWATSRYSRTSSASSPFIRRLPTAKTRWAMRWPRWPGRSACWRAEWGCFPPRRSPWPSPPASMERCACCGGETPIR